MVAKKSKQTKNFLALFFYCRKKSQMEPKAEITFDFGVIFPEEMAEVNKMSDAEINNFINGQKAKATKYKDTSDYNIFVRFCSTINEKRPIEEIPAEDLDNILCQFFINAKNRKGTDYEPDTLSSIRNSLQRVLTERGSSINIREDKEFIKSHKVLASRRKQLTKLGKGNKENAARALTFEEVDHLFKEHYFGTRHPVALQRTVWWILTQHFGHRARDEGRQLKFGDIKIEKEFGSEEKYLVWKTERSTKTRTGERPMGHKRAFNPKAFATGDEKCPVMIFEEFVTHRPKTSCKDESPLFLQVRHNIECDVVNIWYFDKPLGKNSIGNFMKDARSLFDSDRGKISNHSARKTTITHLLENNVNPLHVQQISGHKKLESLNQYNTASLNQQRTMSKIISGSSSNNHLVQQPSTSSSRSNENIPLCVQQQLMQSWNPFNSGIFQGTTMNNCVFNFNIGVPQPQSQTTTAPPKRRRVMIEDDADDE